MRLKRRRYQTRCVDALKTALRSQRKRALIDMATGLGKTVTVGLFVKWFLKKKLGRVLFLCHQNDLVEQLEKKVREVVGDGYTYGVFHGKKKVKGDVDVLFASLQTMRNWKACFGKDAFALVVVDEAHHSGGETFKDTILYFKSRLTVGMTATPNRKTRRIYGKPVFRLSLERALAARLLTPVRYSVYLDSTKSLDEVVEGRPARKLSVTELNARLFNHRTEDEIARIVAGRMAEVPNAQAMVFASDIGQCERFSEALGKYLPEVSTVHYQVDTDDRTDRLEQFRAGKLRALTARDVLNEGIDVPAVTHVVFLRATNSMRIFLQQIGRALRRLEGKLQVYVLDFVGNCERLTLVSELMEQIEAAVARRRRKGRTVATPFELEDGDESSLPQFAHRVRDLLEILSVIRAEWTDDRILDSLRGLHGTLGRPLRSTDLYDAWRRGELPYPTVLKRRFDPKGKSFVNSLERAGVPMKKGHPEWTEDTALESLRSLYRRLNRPVMLADVHAGSLARACPPTSWLARTFDPKKKDFRLALKQAGVPFRKSGRKNWTREAGTLALKGLQERLKRPLTRNDIDEQSALGVCPTQKWIISRFDPEGKSVFDGLAKAGVKSARKRVRKKWTEETALQALRDLRSDLGRLPNSRDIPKGVKVGRCPSTSYYYQHFGDGKASLKPALEKAGLL